MIDDNQVCLSFPTSMANIPTVKIFMLVKDQGDIAPIIVERISPTDSVPVVYKCLKSVTPKSILAGSPVFEAHLVHPGVYNVEYCPPR